MTARVPPDCAGSAAEVVALWEAQIERAEMRRSALWLEAMASAHGDRVDLSAEAESLALRRAERELRDEIANEWRAGDAAAAALCLREALQSLGGSLFETPGYGTKNYDYRKNF